MSEPTPRFIVVFKPHVTKEQVEEYAQKVNDNGGDVTHRYDNVLNGFAATLPDNFMQNLQGDDLIDYIEPDGFVTIQQQ
ncbi:hypothetical protein AMATHDRAFT_67561 [Amanita thiersii Skay4041]|uniref:Inhibitor I9 domain-containing protein n=1 Tax=Amanita thiersii Skay4041 TaxID=703135 RepID=A0A2A9NIG4_9AGAR|nr:hypothetical protein AMATHDRAFT_67561 [Amanita thiersii Skay4041]